MKQSNGTDSNHQKKDSDERRNARLNKDKIGLTFQVGDWVSVKACKVSNAAVGKVAKFLAIYEGPYQVKKKIARNTYIHDNMKTGKERGQFHAMDLKPYRIESREEEGITDKEGVTVNGGDDSEKDSSAEASENK